MSDSGEILVDTHVHLHACFSPQRFFDAAVTNLRTGMTSNGPRGAVAGCLLFTESHGVNAFAALHDRAAAGVTVGAGGGAETTAAEFGAWKFEATGEDNSLWATRTEDDTDRLLLVAGRQLVTREKLEVLALGCTAELDDGMELRTAIDAASAAGAVPVIPWGFGKWWGRRGALLTALIDEPEAGPRYFLGDNGGRAAMLPRPALFRAAAQRGVLMLPGSDPLPFAAQVSRPGRCGVRLAVDLDAGQPAAAVLEALRRLDRQPAIFGRYESLPGFVRSQVAMQLRKVSA